MIFGLPSVSPIFHTFSAKVFWKQNLLRVSGFICKIAFYKLPSFYFLSRNIRLNWKKRLAIVKNNAAEEATRIDRRT